MLSKTKVSKDLGLATDLTNTSGRSASRAMPKARLTYGLQLDCNLSSPQRDEEPTLDAEGRWEESKNGSSKDTKLTNERTRNEQIHQRYMVKKRHDGALLLHINMGQPKRA